MGDFVIFPAGFNALKSGHVAFCRVLSFFVAFCHLVLACAGWRTDEGAWSLEHGARSLKHGAEEGENFTVIPANFCKCLIEYPKLDRFWTKTRRIFRQSSFRSTGVNGANRAKTAPSSQGLLFYDC